MSEPVKQSREGGCRCRAVRYRAEGAPLWVVHCHCRDCRQVAGTAFVTWIGFRANQVSFTRGDAARARYASSPGVTRTFCATCGTPLSFEGETFPGEIHLMVGTLDDPAAVTPTHHIWTSEALPWALPSDGLKRRVGGPGSKVSEPS